MKTENHRLKAEEQPGKQIPLQNGKPVIP